MPTYVIMQKTKVAFAETKPYLVVDNINEARQTVEKLNSKMFKYHYSYQCVPNTFMEKE
jgi:hypothetical protein